MSIEKAAEAIVEKSHQYCATWITIEEARELARAALPHLLEEPTDPQTIEAARNMDWVQVVLNGGPPCFHLEDSGRFCGRAERWHDAAATKMFHSFRPLDDLLARRRNAPPEPLKGEWENIKDLLFGLSSAGFDEINRRVHEAYRRGARLNQAASVEPLETHTIVYVRSDTPRTTVTIYNVSSLKLDGVDVLPKSAAPPVSEPRREAIKHVLREYPDRAPEIADRILSTLDSLKGNQP